jgi:alkanesulfonate monooxygenase SsuD/methylene tetrahydromethanopterin reductase-like flavin-dependent oxidoreductase (luciferase family)
MNFGVFLFATDYSIRPGEFARSAEQRGFDSVFFPEHTHTPTSTFLPAAEHPSRWAASCSQKTRIFTTCW